MTGLWSMGSMMGMSSQMLRDRGQLKRGEMEMSEKMGLLLLTP